MAEVRNLAGNHPALVAARDANGVSAILVAIDNRRPARWAWSPA